MKKVFALTLALLLIVSSLAMPAMAAKAKTKVTLDKKGTVKLDLVQKTLKLTATVTPDPSAQVTWTSSKKKVATVDQQGNVTALKEGTATITAKVGKKSAKVKIKVFDSTKPTKLTLKNGKKATLTAGDTLQLTPVLSPDTAVSEVTFKSSKKSVASVDGNGLVTTHKKGKAKITVTSKKNKKAKAVITINVKKAPPSNDLYKYIGMKAKKVQSIFKLKVKYDDEERLFLAGEDFNFMVYPNKLTDKSTISAVDLSANNGKNIMGLTVGMPYSEAEAKLLNQGYSKDTWDDDDFTGITEQHFEKDYHRFIVVYSGKGVVIKLYYID